jgi:hypothetical protein
MGVVLVSLLPELPLLLHPFLPFFIPLLVLLVG